MPGINQHNNILKPSFSSIAQRAKQGLTSQLSSLGGAAHDKKLSSAFKNKLKMQTDNPSPARHSFSSLLTNASKKFSSANVKEMFFGSAGNSKNPVHNLASSLLQDMYEYSDTFRAMFNHTYRDDVVHSGNMPQWSMNTGSNYTSHAGSGEAEMQLGLQNFNEILSGQNHLYETENGNMFMSPQMALGHSAITAMSGLNDNEIVAGQPHPRGPITEFNNIVQTEMADAQKLAFRPCTQKNNPPQADEPVFTSTAQGIKQHRPEARRPEMSNASGSGISMTPLGRQSPVTASPGSRLDKLSQMSPRSGTVTSTASFERAQQKRLSQASNAEKSNPVPMSSSFMPGRDDSYDSYDSKPAMNNVSQSDPFAGRNGGGKQDIFDQFNTFQTPPRSPVSGQTRLSPDTQRELDEALNDDLDKEYAQYIKDKPVTTSESSDVAAAPEHESNISRPSTAGTDKAESARAGDTSRPLTPDADAAIAMSSSFMPGRDLSWDDYDSQPLANQDARHDPLTGRNGGAKNDVLDQLNTFPHSPEDENASFEKLKKQLDDEYHTDFKNQEVDVQSSPEEERALADLKDALDTEYADLKKEAQARA